MGSTQHSAGNHSLLSVWRRKDASPWVEITIAVAFVMLPRDIVHSAILTDYIVDGFCDFVEKRSLQITFIVTSQDPSGLMFIREQLQNST